MSTVSRAIASGAGLGALSGCVIGIALAAFLLIDAEGIELITAFVIYGTIGAMIGGLVGVSAGIALGLLVGLALNLLLGPANLVPRRPEQLPVVRLVGSAIGLLPLIAVPQIAEWWPVAIIVSLLAMVAIAKRVPKIAGITSLSDRSPKP